MSETKKPDERIVPGMSSFAEGKLLELQSAIADRKLEALKLYRSMPHQEAFHACRISERIVLGGNRCLSGDQEIYDPVAHLPRKIREIDSDFHVMSWKDGQQVIRRASKPYVKGIGDIYRVTFSDGRFVLTTLEHEIHSRDGWTSVADAAQQKSVLCPPGSISDTSPSVSQPDACYSTQRAQDCQGGCSPDLHQCDEQLPWVEEPCQAWTPSPVDARERSRSRLLWGDLGSTEGRTLPCRSSPLPSIPCALGHPSDLVAASSLQHGDKPCLPPCQTPQGACQFGQQSFHGSRTSPSVIQHPKGLGFSSASTEPPWWESKQITTVELVGQEEIWDITVDETECYFAGGVLHHNSGKTCAGAVEIARALTGQDPYGKYPKEDGICVVIGRNWQHIGMVSYPMLFKAGAFSIIRDKKTKEWRAFDPKKDEKRRSERKNAPPLVPPRMIKEISWLLKSAGYCQQVTLTNGWKIYFFSSEGEPPQGFKADLVAIDEDVANPAWVGEMLSRLADRKGRFVWTAMPHSKNDALLGLCDRADKEEENNVEKRTIKKFTFRFLDNNHIDQEEKEKNLTRWGAIGVDELRMRAEGEFTQDSFLMYPSFNRSVHIIPMDKIPGGITTEWTRYMAVDPGHTVMAAIFGAIPPDESMLLIYDELYIHHANAKIFGEELEKKVRDQYFRSFIMDMQGGRLTGFGDGRPPHELYTEDLARRNIRSEVTGSEFIPGSTNKIGRAEIVRSLLHIGGNGKPRLMFLDGATPNLVEEIRRFKKSVTRSKDGDRITDAPNTRGNVHAVQALEYLCAYEPKYHRPPLRPGPEPWYVRWLENRKKRQGEEGGNFVCLGPTRRG